MNPGKSGSIKGVDDEIRRAAVEAAREADMPLDEWLNRTIAELAVKDLVQPAADTRSRPGDDDIAALTLAVTRLTQRIRQMDSVARSSVSGLRARLGEIETRLAGAQRAESGRRDESLRGVATLVDRLSRDLNGADETARALVEGIGSRRVAAAAPPQPASSNAGDAMRDLDAQIAEIAGRLRVPPPAPAAPPAPVRTARLDDLKKRLDSLLARAPEAAPNEPAASRAAGLDSTLKALEARLEDSRFRGPPAPPPAVHLAPEEDERLRRIEARLSDIGERLGDSARRPPEPPKHDELEAAIAAIAAEQQRSAGAKGDLAALRREQKTVVDALAALGADVAALSARLGGQNHDADRADLAAMRLEQRQMTEALAALSADVAGLGALAAEQRRSATDPADLAALRREQRQMTDSLAVVSTDLSDLVGKVAAIGRRDPADDESLFALTRRIDALAGEQPADRGMISDIRYQLELLRQETDQTAREATLLDRFDDLIRKLPDRGRLDALGEEVAAVRQLIENDDSPKAVARLEMRLSEIGRSVEATMHSREAAADASSVGLAAVLADIRGAIEDIAATDRGDRTSDAMADFAASLADIRHAIETRQASPTPADDAAITRLEARFDEIAARIDGVLDRAAPAEMLVDLQTRLAGLVGRLDNVHQGAGQPAILDDIRAEIAAIRSEIGTREPPRLDNLEGQVRDLADRLETVMRPDADPRHLADLEARVTRLADDLAQSAPPTAALRQVEENLMQLQAHLSDSRAESVEAARNAARDAVREFAGSRVEADLVRSLRSDLDHVRTAAGRSDDRTRETLDTIVNRLGKIEADDGRGPGAPAAEIRAPAPARAETTTAAPDVAPARRAEGQGRGDRAPEAAAAKPDLAALRELAANTTDPERKPADRRADFIAAARRAAQAAVAEAGRVEGPAGPKPGAFARIGQAIRNRRRPLLLAAAAIVLAIGALQLFGQRPESSGNLAARAPAPKAAVVAGATPATRPPGDSAGAPTIPSVDNAALVAPGSDARTAMALAAAPVESRFGDAFSGETAGGFAAPETAASDGGEDAPVITASLAAPGTVPAAGAATESAGLPLIGSDKLRAAAEAGDATAAYEIATRYAEGRNVERNLTLASKWYERAALSGVAVAQYRLGSLYERGQGLDKNLVAAVTWYQRAADQGNVGAMHNLAVMMSEGVDGTPDHAKALEWFLAAANYGVKDSQYNLGVIYARGLGAEADLIESYKWFSAAAAQGDTDAAGRRDEVAGMLDPDQLAKARAVAQAWHAKPPLAEVNTVKAPEGGWDNTTDTIADADRAALVKKIQTLLADQGYDPGPADGVDGPKTREAVKAFQRTIGAADTGSIDGNLVTALADHAGSF